MDAADRERRRPQFFVTNPVTDQVATWFRYCQTAGKCVCITGDSGIGKTETLDRILAGKRGVFRIQAGPLRNQARHLMQYLRDAIGEDHPAFHMASNPADGIARFFTTHSFAIVVDDFDMLIASAYEFLLRDLWNQTRLADKTVPIFMAGNVEGVRHLRKLSPQLASRVRHVPLECTNVFKLDVVRKFMGYHLPGLELTTDMLKLGVALANSPAHGHLRALEWLCSEVTDALRGDPSEDAPLVFADRYHALTTGELQRFCKPCP